jgi:hypothetical protein
MVKHSQAFPTQLIAALAGFTVVAGSLVIIIPTYDLVRYLSWISTDQRRLKLGVTAYLVFVLTAALLWVARRALKLPLSWFLYALLFNGTIVFIKFISSPNTYGALTSNALIAPAVGVGLFYVLGLWGIYAFFDGKLLKSLHKTTKDTNELKLLFAAGLFVAINFLRIVIFSLPPFAKTATADYLTSTFRGGGLVLSVLLFLIIFGAVEAFDRTKHDKATLRNAFLLGLAMLVIYHVLWAIFVRRLGVCGC